MFRTDQQSPRLFLPRQAVRLSTFLGQYSFVLSLQFCIDLCAPTGLVSVVDGRLCGIDRLFVVLLRLTLVLFLSR